MRIDHLSLLGIAVGLAMDALSVSVANGAAARRVKPAFALKLAVSFGVFQSLMPFIGWLVGKAGEAIISSVDHWIALILLGFLGIQMLREARKRDDGDETLQEDVPWRRVLTLAVATSIDALATGVLLPSAVGADTVARMLLSVGEIGLVTLVLCFFGVYLGRKFGELLRTRAQVVGGIVLIAIGVKIFVEHMWFS